MEITTSEVQPLYTSTPAHNNNVPQETYKVLLAWLEDEWAVEVRSSLIADTPENHAKAVADCKTRVAARSVFTPVNLVTEIAENELVKAVKAQPEFSFIETYVKSKDAGGSCRIALVNLSDVLAVQPLVRIDNLGSRLIQGALSEEQLYGVCFPPNQPSDTVTIDNNDRGYTITTLDPNMQVVPWNDIPMNPPLAPPKYQLQYPSASSPLQVRLFPFALVRTPNYLQVVHHQGRYILRDGYTRAAALLYQNVRQVPCVLIETEDPDLVFRPDVLNPEIVLGARPPRLSDFWEDAVTCLWTRPATRKVYHITMEEIEVLR
jgi:hypothetical protein